MKKTKLKLTITNNACNKSGCVLLFLPAMILKEKLEEYKKAA